MNISQDWSVCDFASLACSSFLSKEAGEPADGGAAWELRAMKEPGEVVEDGEGVNEGNLPRAEKVGTVTYEMGQKGVRTKT